MFNTKNRKIGVLTVRVAGEKSKQRVKEKLSQAELAKGICTQATISNIENKNVKFRHFLICMSRLDLQVEECIEGSSEKTRKLIK